MAKSDKGQRLFSPESTFWQVNRERLVGLTGGRAVLLELAHPMIATGVAAHSDFRKHPFRRLFRTMSVMSNMVFGTMPAVARSQQKINACHRRVRGTLKANAGPFARGAIYSANDPQLKLWVFATLVDSALLGYELLVAPLTAEEKEAYYRDSLVTGSILGIKKTVMPDTYERFSSYMDDMLAGNQLCVTDPAREQLDALMRPRAARPLMLFGLSLLPERMRDDFGITLSDSYEKRTRRVAAFSRRIRPMLPDLVATDLRALWAEWQTNPN